jgi:hypothetical protein
MSNEKLNKQKPSKPQITPRTGLVESTVGVQRDAPRKPFTRNLTLNVGKRKYLVIGGLAPKDADGRQPYVTAQTIAKRLGIPLHECVCADPREIGKIEAATAAGLEVRTLDDMLKGLNA